MVRAIKNIISSRIHQGYWGEIEKKYGGNIMADINSGDEHREKYEITAVHHLKFFEKYLRKAGITEKDSMFDVGCGRGGMLLHFSHYPFKKIGGLEYSQEVADSGLDNLSKWGIDAQIIIDDAARFDGYDEYNYFYLANPFDDVIMKEFLRHLNDSIMRRPRPVTVLYENCIYKDMFVEDGFQVVSYFKRNMFHAAESIVLRKENEGIVKSKGG